QSYGQYSVFLRRLRLTAWMIMGKEDVCCVAENRRLKDFTRMHHTCRQTPDRNCMEPDHFVFLIEHQHNEMLPIHIGKVRMYEYTGISRAADLFVITMQSAFTDQGDAINGYTIFPDSGCHVLLKQP